MDNETAVVEQPQSQESPTLAEAYGDRSVEGTSVRKPRQEEPRRNQTLSEEADTSRQMTESGRGRPLPKREQTLSEAHDGIEPDEDAEVVVDQDGLPEELADYELDDVLSMMDRFGLNADDLENPRMVSLLKSKLEGDLYIEKLKWERDHPGEEYEPETIDEEDSKETQEQTEEAKKAEDAKPETKPAALPDGKKLADLTPEERQVMQKHVEDVFQRSKQVSAPAYSEHFTQALAKALDTPPEAMERLGGVVEILQFGAQNLMETAVPALVTQYMRDNFAPQFGQILESYVPGLADSFREATVANTWADTLESEEFKNANLPKWGTPEFQEAAETVHKNNPWLLSFDPTGPDGKPLPIMQALRVKAAVTARLLAGERMSPQKIAQQVAEAVKTGKQSAEKSTRRVSASRALKGGRTEGKMGSQASERESLMEAWERGGGGGAI